MINSIDEAITRCNKKAEELKKQGSICCDSLEDTIRAEKCLESAKEYELFAGWLTELKQRREQDNKGKWVMITVSDGKGGWKRAPVCNRCACRKPDNIRQPFSNNFCPHCGAAMEGSEQKIIQEEYNNMSWDETSPEQEESKQPNEGTLNNVCDLNDGIFDPTYINGIVDCSDLGIYPWGNS